MSFFRSLASNPNLRKIPESMFLICLTPRWMRYGSKASYAYPRHSPHTAHRIMVPLWASSHSTLCSVCAWLIANAWHQDYCLNVRWDVWTALFLTRWFVETYQWITASPLYVFCTVNFWNNLLTSMYHFDDKLFRSHFQFSSSTRSKTVSQIKVLRFCILLKNP